MKIGSWIMIVVGVVVIAGVSIAFFDPGFFMSKSVLVEFEPVEFEPVEIDSTVCYCSNNNVSDSVMWVCGFEERLEQMKSDSLFNLLHNCTRSDR